jgi:hypothetical protein
MRRAHAAIWAGALRQKGAAVLSAARHGPVKGFEGMDKADPFGERTAWDHSVTTARLHGVDVEALGEAMDSEESQRTHFGPEWARFATVSKHAMGTMKPKGPGDAPRVHRGRDGKEVTARSPSAKWNGVLGSMPQTYEELAASSEMEGEADTDPNIPESISPDSGTSWEDVRRETFGGARPPPTGGPGTRRAQSEDADDAVASGEAADVGSSGDGISAADPLEWDNSQVVAWLRKYGDIDDDMASAFEMVRVDGKMLLNDVMPCDMFKEMRKWHKRGRKDAPKVPVLLVQETIYLCYPYGK